MGAQTTAVIGRGEKQVEFTQALTAERRECTGEPEIGVVQTHFAGFRRRFDDVEVALKVYEDL